MGAIFRDKKKLVKYNKYSIMYQWDKYNAVAKNVTHSQAQSGVGNGSRIFYFSNTNASAVLNNIYNVYEYNIAGNLTEISITKDEGTKNITNYKYYYSKAFGQGYYCKWKCSDGFKITYDGSRIYPLSDNNTYSVFVYSFSKGSTYYGTVTSSKKSDYPNGTSFMGYPDYCKYYYVYTGETKGDFLETIQANKGTYPDGGVKDGYYYELA